MRKKEPFVWGPEQGVAFHNLKELMTITKALAYFRNDCKTRIVAETSLVIHKPKDLKIVSLNVSGLGNNAKRIEVFNWLRMKNQSIYMLQEVHCSEGTMDIWTCEWGYKALFSGCSSSKAGVCILFNNNFNLQIHKVLSDPNGRDIVADSKN